MKQMNKNYHLVSGIKIGPSDMVGYRNGLRIVIGPRFMIGAESLVVVECECGSHQVIRPVRMTNKRFASKSCGCTVSEASRAKATRHGHANKKTGKMTSEYISWVAMRNRCYNEKAINFDRYGARGIRVCDEWKTSFEAFLRDMGCKPSPSHSLDRIDSSKDYCPENCRWATDAEQNRNKRNNWILTFYGKSMTASEWSRISGVKASTIFSRLRCGVPEKEAVWLPVTITRRRLPRADEPAKKLQFHRSRLFRDVNMEVR